MGSGSTYRILIVSNGWLTVTAPQAARPPARKALEQVSHGHRGWELVAANPVVVAIASYCGQ